MGVGLKHSFRLIKMEYKLNILMCSDRFRITCCWTRVFSVWY